MNYPLILHSTFFIFPPLRSSLFSLHSSLITRLFAWSISTSRLRHFDYSLAPFRLLARAILIIRMHHLDYPQQSYSIVANRCPLMSSCVRCLMFTKLRQLQRAEKLSIISLSLSYSMRKIRILLFFTYKTTRFSEKNSTFANGTTIN